METKRPQIVRDILRNKNEAGEIRLYKLQTILQSYSHQKSVMSHTQKKQKYRLMEKDRKSRDRPMHLWSPNLRQRRQEYAMGKRQSLQ